MVYQNGPSIFTTMTVLFGFGRQTPNDAGYIYWRLLATNPEATKSPLANPIRGTGTAAAANHVLRVKGRLRHKGDLRFCVLMYIIYLYNMISYIIFISIYLVFIHLYIYI